MFKWFPVSYNIHQKYLYCKYFFLKWDSKLCCTGHLRCPVKTSILVSQPRRECSRTCEAVAAERAGECERTVKPFRASGTMRRRRTRSKIERGVKRNRAVSRERRCRKASSAGAKKFTGNTHHIEVTHQLRKGGEFEGGNRGTVAPAQADTPP